MHKLLAVLVICTILSVGCAPLAAPTITPTSEFPTLSMPPATPTPTITTVPMPTHHDDPGHRPTPTAKLPTLSTGPATTPAPVGTLDQSDDIGHTRTPRPPTPGPTRTPGYYPDLHISLSVTDPWCNGGKCRIQWDIDGNGHVRYEEKGRMLRVPSVRSGTITREQVQELVDAFRQADAFPLQQEPFAKDLSETWLSITFDGRSKQFVHYYGSLGCGGSWVGDYVGLCELEQKINAIADQWSTPTATP